MMKINILSSKEGNDIQSSFPYRKEQLNIPSVSLASWQTKKKISGEKGGISPGISSREGKLKIGKHGDRGLKVMIKV